MPDRTKDALEQLGAAAESLRSQPAWLAMLATRAKFHTYSVRNQILIWCQRPDATQVAGFKAWKALGRQVRKGEKGLWILAPMTRRDKEADELRIFGFRAVAVFDISQTDGDPLPEVPWPETDTAPVGLLARLATNVRAAGFTLDLAAEADPLRPRARGWCRPAERSIHVVTASEPSQCATLLHELAHCCDPDLPHDPDRATRELVAESAAYVVGVRLSVGMTAEVEHYLASWQADQAALLALLDRVRHTEAAMQEVLGVVTLDVELGAA